MTKTYSLALAVFSVAVIFFAGIAFAAIPVGPVGYWALNENGGAIANDSSATNDDGAVNGSAVYTTASIPATPGNISALTFDGVNGFVSIPNNAALDMTVAYSLSAWVNVTDLATYRPILFRGATDADDIEVYVQSGSGDLIVAHNRGNGGTFDFVGFSPPPVGTLFHLVVTYDGTNVQAYYDGVAAAVSQQTTAVDAPLDTNKGWMIGKVDHSAFPGAFFFKGLLDEVLIYNRVLTTAEIAALEATGTTLVVDDDGIVGLDGSCDGTGAIAYTTIQAAVNAANPGDIVNVCPGIYVEAVDVNKSLTLKSTTLNGAIIKPSNNANPGIYIDTVNNVTIDGFEIDGTVGLIQTGISGLNSNNATLTNNLIHDIKDSPANNAGLGIVLYGWDQGIDNALIQGNTVYNTDRHGIWIGAVQSDGVTPIVSNNNVIKNNTVHHSWQDPECGTIPEPCWGGAIGMDTGKNGSIEANSIHDTGGNQRDIMLINGAYDDAITGNTILHTGATSYTQPAIEHSPRPTGGVASSGLTVTNNIITVTPNTGADANSWVIWLPNVGGTNSFNGNTLTLTTTAPPSHYHGFVLYDVDGVAGVTGDWTIQGNTFEGDNLGPNSVGIRLYDTLPATSNISITGNQIHGWANGIRSNVLANAGLVTANRNSITGNSVNGVLDGGSVPDINATCNWWGSLTGPSGNGPGTGDSAVGNVDFEPWLTTSDLAGPCNGPLPQVTVTMVKYIDGVHADAASANNSAFPMLETWTATNFNGTDVAFDLDPTGLNIANPYEARTQPAFDAGVNFTMHEVTGGPVVGASCADGYPFALVGYSSGDTLELAAATAATTTEPNFTGMTSSTTIIVWNKSCTAKLTLDKVVINNSGGTQPESAWTISAAGPTPISGPGAPGSTDVQSGPGFVAGTYTLSESAGPAGYTASAWSCVKNGGSPVSGSSITLAPGDDATCKITNNDNPGILIVKKVLINDNGGTSATTTFKFKVNGGTAQAFQSDGQNDIAVASSTYSVVENAALGYLTTYSSVNGANCNGLVVAQGQTVTCTITNDDVPPPPLNACSLPLAPGYTLVLGTPASNVVTLAPYSMFVGNGGNDTVISNKNGNYIVCTLGGNDTIKLSGKGAVTIDAGNGRNAVVLGNMTGFITTGTGIDVISAGNGARTISAGDGDNSVITGNGDQIVTTGIGNDFVSTNGGNDTIDVGAGKNKVLSRGGSDSLTALGGNDFFDAGAGADICSPGGGSNTVLNCAP